MADRRRRQQRWGWFVGAAAAALYLAGLGGATAAGFAAASLVRKAVSSREFRDALHAARHPVTEADLPRLLPGIPVYPGARPLPMLMGARTSNAQRGTTQVWLTTPDPPQKVAAFYRTRMAGWTLEQSDSQQGGLAFRRGDAQCLITVAARPVPGLGRGRQYVLGILFRPGEQGKGEP